ncbi:MULTISPECIES: methylthioribulose 1-phosphate dehydratase [Thioalkalivibrio]|uniref:Methylthioribulose-1-phosphate dehydratase n=1 Tax=Thioalkalivibrio halophilus TaxID=252474 RepID=A0A1V2ZZZ4_9GAMM|nr:MULTISPECIES: methylthioribulose 1-phosphate dehydratase [Thioalkalivibrio]OOC10672.1 methylthioribulose 1-phosphate dehydratase [Thioalkalivibrio halophilus]PYG01226.1 methylthioribulose-1-phosphate dehydratase [Thioalkalivibrio sp. ALE21]
MENSLEFKAQVSLLADAGARLAARGWLPARAGHFSARLDDRHIVVSAPGRQKDMLDENDFIIVDLDGNLLSPAERTPSPETFLHIIMYRRDKDLGAVLHTHSANATVLSRQLPGGLHLSDYEVLRELPVVQYPAEGIDVPVFANDPNVQQLAAQVDDRMSRQPDLAGYLIAGHGLYTWSHTVETAIQRVEAFEFMFECEILARQLHP